MAREINLPVLDDPELYWEVDIRESYVVVKLHKKQERSYYISEVGKAFVNVPILGWELDPHFVNEWLIEYTAGKVWRRYKRERGFEKDNDAHMRRLEQAASRATKRSDNA